MLDFIDEENQERRNIAEFYHNEFKKLADFITPPEYSPSQSTCHFYPFFVKSRDKLLAFMSANNIFPSMHYRSNTNYKVYSKIIDKVPLGGASYYETNQITFPIYPGLLLSDLDRISQVVNEFYIKKID